ncbi:DUF2892 domain-containing protein [Pontibacter qinzhouensis]|uniref:DUF2892 domain-containing protein n=1 Tax=Pontibacter qinzhouensis TaxID=2603253 RepID=A0A5C8K8Y6_9BACT|nr:DUF2892 domain-containing protein [Pontibacter qinzhouensis]TXK45854.1 DUF2892 domain-containing protein [Pontibacter qinzhouensis]
MTKNMGATDRIVRSALAAGTAALIATRSVKGPAAIVLGGLATIFALTGSVGHCPAYDVADINTL